MPYITKKEREALVLGRPLENAGQLNYCISVLILAYLETKGMKYQTLNDIIGALEGAKAEFYRRVVIPYEDQKMKENGDINE